MIPADAFVIQTSEAIVKAIPDSSGRRIVEVEASVEQPDAEGDIVLQKALLDDAGFFVSKGHLDKDHFSEFGGRPDFRARYGLTQPASYYVIGNPLEVKNIGEGRTSVVGELQKSSVSGPVQSDEIWHGLMASPPVKWFSSVYGFPIEMETCRGGVCKGGATRYIVKSMRWKSLAFTRRPVCTGIKGAARVIMSKSLDAALAEGAEDPFETAFETTVSKGFGDPVPAYAGMDDLWRHRTCVKCGVHSGTPSVMRYRHHFADCEGHPPGTADIHAHAMMYREMRRRQMAAGIGL